MASQATKSQSGFSLISLIIGAAVFSVVLAATLKLYASGLSASGNSAQANVEDHLTQLSRFLTYALNRGGGGISQDDRNRGIQLCSLSGSNNNWHCESFQASTQNLCMVLPIVKDPSTNPSIEVQGFRLVDQTLYQKQLSAPAGWSNFNARQFCESESNWIALHEPRDFKIDRVRFCKFNSATPTQVLGDYLNNCPSVLTPDSTNTNSTWLVTLDVNMNNGATRFSRPFVTRLYNWPVVGSL